MIDRDLLERAIAEAYKAAREPKNKPENAPQNAQEWHEKPLGDEQ